eukprot:GSMAST32.ASY1.ANO1.2501.1 assembled CDS
MSRFGRSKRKPAGYAYIEPILDALDEEMRRAVERPSDKLRKNEALWPIHQITWQRSRYVYDMYYKYKKISRELYDWCIREKLIDGSLCAKWKKPGYDKLCSVHVINTRNTNYGTTSVCRVPKKDLDEGTVVFDHMTGCRGCASGREGCSNIFGNKYGQFLASIQIAREERAKAQGQEYSNKKETAYGNDDEATVAEENQDGEAKEMSRQKKENEPWLGGQKPRDVNSIAPTKDKLEQSKSSVTSSNRGQKRNNDEVDSDASDNEGFDSDATDAGGDGGGGGDSDTEGEDEISEKKRSLQNFIPSKSFTGSKKGYYFSKGADGLGYYIDNNATVYKGVKRARH